MKKIVKMLQTVERTVGDPWIGDVSYTLNINEADPLIKNGWAVLVAEVPDNAPLTSDAPEGGKKEMSKSVMKRVAVQRRSAEHMTTKKAGKK